MALPTRRRDEAAEPAIRAAVDVAASKVAATVKAEDAEPTMVEAIRAAADAVERMAPAAGLRGAAATESLAAALRDAAARRVLVPERAETETRTVAARQQDAPP
jgi:hypothetical protein